MVAPGSSADGGSPSTGGPDGGALTRRSFLVGSAAAALAACGAPIPEPSPRASSAATTGPPSPDATPSPPSQTTRPNPTPTPSGSATPAPSTGRTLYRGGALADGRSARLRLGVSILVEAGRIAWLSDADDEPDPGPTDGLEVVDAAGATFIPGLVDAHSHVTLPGGANWIERAGDPTASLVAAAERNGPLMTAAGVRWARDVGAVRRADPIDGRERALSLGVRDRRSGQAGWPHIRAAGTWLTRTGSLPDGLGVEVSNADALLAAALGQLDDGADFVKLYLDGPDASTSPWTTTELRPVVEAVHARGAQATAHSGRLAGARAGVAAGVDALEHGFELDADVAAEMARRGTALVSTLAVMRSWLTFGRTTSIRRFATTSGRRVIEDRLERAESSVRVARAAGVAIAAGTDFGGGSLRANQLAWEVESLVAAGLEPWEALGAATWRGGELLGEPDAGTLREGGPADFALVHGDPLSDPAALWRVWRIAWIG
jgi:imidazolonepropionase-like amidohydrolase